MNNVLQALKPDLPRAPVHEGAAAARATMAPGGPLLRLSGGDRCVSESRSALTRAAGSVPSHHLVLLQNRLELSRSIWKGMALAPLPTIQPEAVFIPDIDFPAIKLEIL